MLINVRGRVGMDPMRVPLAASMATGRDDTFAQVLQDTVAAEEPETQPEAPARDEVAPSEPEVAAPPPAEAPSDDDQTTTTATDLVAQANDGTVAHAVTMQPAEVTESIRRGEPGRQETAGKGTDSPRTSSAASEPLLAAFVQQRAQPNAGVVAFAPGGKVEAVGGVRPADGNGRGAATIAEARGTAALKTPAAAASYRTSGAATAELLEQARDSVFKQILMKLNGDGGEMRLRLEPPDLGELDLRLVSDGNKLQLAIAAERQDVNDLLHRHLDALKQTLAAAGLELTGASVQTRSEFARDQQSRDAQAALAGGSIGGDAEDDDTTTPVRHGYVSATGLDFWA